ncbi:WXG100 family type VII secretion target [Nocardia higoensis]|uniref:WXG100 family type VII secretion target n=1 Tax=Nocardia higoensis TaxID=228599 RepID=UPI0002EBE1B9|nr:WXG100 family type VII secretion target [Nocardia higoensis]
MHNHGTDGRIISDTENPHSFSHARIAQAASRMAPGEITTAVDAWTEIAGIVSAAVDRFEAAVARAVELGWEGAAADAAQPRVRDLVTGLSSLAAALEAQTGPVQAAADAAARFRAAIPPAVEAATGSDAARARNTAEEQARDDMTNLYLRPYTAIAPTLPAFPSPATRVAAGSGPASGGAGEPERLLGAAGFGGEGPGEAGSVSPEAEVSGDDDATSTVDAEADERVPVVAADGPSEGTGHGPSVPGDGSAGVGPYFSEGATTTQNTPAQGGTRVPALDWPDDSVRNGASGDDPVGVPPISGDGPGGLGNSGWWGASDGDGPVVGGMGHRLPPEQGESSAPGSAETSAASAGASMSGQSMEHPARQPVTPASTPAAAAPPTSSPAAPVTSAPASPTTPLAGGAPQYNAPAAPTPAAPGIGTSPPPSHTPLPSGPTLTPAPGAATPTPGATAPAPAAMPPAASLAADRPTATAVPLPPAASSTGDRPSAPGATALPGTPAPPNAAGPAPRPGVSVPPQSGPPPAAPPSAPPPTVGPVSGSSIAGTGGYTGVLAAAARLGAKADIEHHLPDYLRTGEHGRELLGEREKTVPPALGADEPAPTGHRRMRRPQPSLHERELPGEPEKTAPPARGAEECPAFDAAPVTDAGPGTQSHRHAARYGQELLGEPRKTVPPAIGADERPADAAGTENTDAIPRLPGLRSFVGSGARPPDDPLPADRTGDCSLSLPPIDQSVATGFRRGQPAAGRDTDFPVHVPPVHGAPTGDEYR